MKQNLPYYSIYHLIFIVHNIIIYKAAITYPRGIYYSNK